MGFQDWYEKQFEPRALQPLVEEGSQQKEQKKANLNMQFEMKHIGPPGCPDLSGTIAPGSRLCTLHSSTCNRRWTCRQREPMTLILMPYSRRGIWRQSKQQHKSSTFSCKQRWLSLARLRHQRAQVQIDDETLAEIDNLANYEMPTLHDKFKLLLNQPRRFPRESQPAAQAVQERQAPQITRILVRLDDTI